MVLVKKRIFWNVTNRFLRTFFWLYLNIFTFTFLFFLFSLTHVMVEKVLFLSQNFELEISMNLHVMKTPKSEKHIFGLRVCACLCVCHQYNSKTNYSRNTKIGILYFIIYTCYLKLFIKISQKLCVQGHTKEF